MRRMMAPLARSDELERLGTQLVEIKADIGKASARIDQVDNKVDGMEVRIAELEKRHGSEPDQPRRGRTSIGSTRSSATENSDTQAWRPRLIHMRGWAPYGAPASSNFPHRGRGVAKRHPPIMYNHMITAEVRHPTFDAVKDATDSVNTAIVRAGVTVRGSTPRAGIETSPSRRESLKVWLSSKDLLANLIADRAFTWCDRALEACTEDGSYKLGLMDKASKEWIWLVGNCRIAGVKIPTHMNGGDQESTDSPMRRRRRNRKRPRTTRRWTCRRRSSTAEW